MKIIIESLIQVYIYLFYQPKVLFKIIPKNIKQISGIKNNTFLRECRDIVIREKLTSGFIIVLKNSEGIMKLKAIYGISKEREQMIRNI